MNYLLTYTKQLTVCRSNDLIWLFLGVVSAIGNAFSVLSNPVCRKRYDEFGLEEVSRAMPRQRRQRRGSDDDDDVYGYSYGFEGRSNEASLYYSVCTHTSTVLMAIFQVNRFLVWFLFVCFGAVCLHVASHSFIPPCHPWMSPLFNVICFFDAMLDAVRIIFTCSTSSASHSALLHHQADWLESQ